MQKETNKNFESDSKCKIHREVNGLKRMKKKKSSNQKKETLVDCALTSRRKVDVYFDSGVFLFAFLNIFLCCFVRCQLKIIVLVFGVFVCLFLFRIFTQCAIQSGQYNQQSRTNNFSLFISFH